MAYTAQSLRWVAGTLSRTLEPLSMWLHDRSGRGTIFLLHRVSNKSDPAYPPLAPAEFEKQCRFFRDHFDIVPLRELVARLHQGQSVARLAAITFDDGYRDFLTDAYPILQSFGFPCTHFLVEDCVRTGRPTWNLRLRHLVPSRLDREDKVAELAKLPASDRMEWLDKTEGAKKPEYPAMLRPEDLGLFDPKLVSWQSHTASHALLNECPGSELDRELSGSRKAIESWTNQPVTMLSYPNGMSNRSSREAAKRAGYECALAVGQTRIPGENIDVFNIPRIDVGGVSRAMLASEVTGIHTALRGIV